MESPDYFESANPQYYAGYDPEWKLGIPNAKKIDRLVEEWYVALFEEDCVRVMQLLEQRPSVLEEGWKSDPSRTVKGRRENFWMEEEQSKWKGRTALHVGARRGCAKLVKQVIKLCRESRPERNQREGHKKDNNIGDSSRFRGPSHYRTRVKELELYKQNGLTFSMEEEESPPKRQPSFYVTCAKLVAQIFLFFFRSLVRHVIDLCNGMHDKWIKLPRKGDQRRGKNITGYFRRRDDPLLPSEADPRKIDIKGKNIAIPSAVRSQDEAVVSSEGRRVGELEAEVRTTSANEDQGRSIEDTPSIVANSISETSDRKSVMMRQLTMTLSKPVVDGTAHQTIGSRALAHLKSKLGKNDLFKEDSNADDLLGQGQRRPGVDNLVSIADLFFLTDGEYWLDAIAMAHLNANLDVLSLLIARCENPEEDSDDRAQLRQMTVTLLERILDDPVSQQYKSVLETYEVHRDFNFLPKGEYLFHFLFSSCFKKKNDDDSVFKAELLRECLWSELCGDYSSDDLCHFVLTLQDGQGRTPLHVAVDEGTVAYFESLLQAIGDNKFRERACDCAMSAFDASNRTAWHRAVAIGDLDAILAMKKFRSLYRVADSAISDSALWFKKWWELSGKDVTDSIEAISLQNLHGKNDASQSQFQEEREPLWHQSEEERLRWYEETQLNAISLRNGFKGQRLVSERLRDVKSTPLHSAIIHRRTDILEVFRRDISGWSYDDVPFACYLDYKICHVFTSLELAAFVGDLRVVRQILQVQPSKRNWVGGILDRLPYFCRRPPQSIHFAASHGSYEMLKAIMESPSRVCDPFIEDIYENTALHYAMNMRQIKFDTHLLDFVNSAHLCKSDPRDTDEGVKEEPSTSTSKEVDRQGCINLLLQAGCDIFKANKEGRIPYPSGELSTNPGFLSWWYGKQSTEFGVIQNNMSFVANAISVTATLVATASYVGPLQPPLGYAGDPSQVQMQNAWVRVFIVCDTLSFYLAIASITFSLIPSLPMPQQPMMDELRRNRVMVTVAVGILLPSIICILVAFAASSIAVISTYGTSTIGGNLTIITSSIGGFFCFLGFILFSIRLLGFVFPRNTQIRKVYNMTSF